MFDIEMLGMLAQGNRALMLTALKDAQQENRRDLIAARQAAHTEDYLTVKRHIHRINGTAQLLGVKALMKVAQSLEDKLPDAISAADLATDLDRIDALLDELDQAIATFIP